MHVREEYDLQYSLVLVASFRLCQQFYPLFLLYHLGKCQYNECEYYFSVIIKTVLPCKPSERFLGHTLFCRTYFENSRDRFFLSFYFFSF